MKTLEPLPYDYSRCSMGNRVELPIVCIDCRRRVFGDSPFGVPVAPLYQDESFDQRHCRYKIAQE